jgi:hypothetical protein
VVFKHDRTRSARKGTQVFWSQLFCLANAGRQPSCEPAFRTNESLLHITTFLPRKNPIATLPCLLFIASYSFPRYCNGLDQRLARKQLCKQVQHATVEEAVFSVVPTDAPIDWLDSDHVICVYYKSMSVPRLYKILGELKLGVQKSTRGQPVKIQHMIWRLYVCYSTVILGVYDFRRPL